MAGSPGGGKSQSILVTLQFIQQLFQTHGGSIILPVSENNRSSKRSKPIDAGNSDSDASLSSRNPQIHTHVHILRLNCMSLTDIDHLYTVINNTLHLVSGKVQQRDKKEFHEAIENVLLHGKALPCTLPMTSLELKYGKAQAINSKISFPQSSRHKEVITPMLILALDELDAMKIHSPNIYNRILSLTSGRVVIVGSGNIVDSIMSSHHSSSPGNSKLTTPASSFHNMMQQYSNHIFTMGFKAYEVDDLISILTYRTGDLFQANAKAFLAKKIKEKQKGIS
jgi:hypothetical protein